MAIHNLRLENEMLDFPNSLSDNKTDHNNTKLVSDIKKACSNLHLVKDFENFVNFNQNNLRKSACSTEFC